MSRSCSRVTSPLPAFSTLITSAPNHASSCVQVGPDCTCVKSRMRTPLNAFSMDGLALRSCNYLYIVWSLVPGAAAQPLGEFAERHVAQKIPDAGALLAVLGELAIADLVHGRVVADDGDVRHAEAVGRLHVEGGHAEGTVAVVAQSFLGGIRKPRCDREARADTE